MNACSVWGRTRQWGQEGQSVPFRTQYQTQGSLLVPSGQMLFQGLSLVLGGEGLVHLGPPVLQVSR